MRAGEVLDQAVALFAPTFALRRTVARMELARLYEAAKGTRNRRAIRDAHSPNAVMQATGMALVREARYLDENHDLVTGALTFLAEMASNVTPRAMIRTRGGELATDLNTALDQWWGDEADSLTAFDSRGEVARDALFHLIARTTFRDGECPSLLLADGTVDALEPDYLPFELNGDSPRG